MSNQVFANNMEVSCKQAAGKSICAFPDVCFTPPLTPATPPGVPIPYPNTGMASDTTSGSTSVKISGQEVMLKNKSYFKRSMGDEAGCAPKKGVVTSKNMGKVYFTMWSMDVKAEGENVVRNLDLTTHNHASFPGNTPTWPYADAASMSDPSHPCVENQIEELQACQGCTPYGDGDPCASADCQKARQCMLVPNGGSGSPNCCSGKSAHHVIPLGEFCKPRGETGGRRGQEVIHESLSGYDGNQAPCVCAEGGDHKERHPSESSTPDLLKEHGLIGGAYIDARVEKGIKNNQSGVKYSDLSDCGAKSVKRVFKHCDEGCIKKQLDNYHEIGAKIPPNDPVCQASQQSRYTDLPKTKVRSK